MKFEKYLESVKLAGPHAKGTDLRDSDVDLFLSYSPNTPAPLSAIQTDLTDHFHGQVRNVAVRIAYNTPLKTDIDKQIRYVRNSGFIDEILAAQDLAPPRPPLSVVSNGARHHPRPPEGLPGAAALSRHRLPHHPPPRPQPTPTTSSPTSSPKSNDFISPVERA